MSTNTQLPNLSWDTCEIAQRQANFLQEQDSSLSDEQAFHLACEDSDILEFEYNDLCDCLTDLMKKLHKGNVWQARVSNFGWRSQSGEMEFTANNGRELLQKVLPRTECTFHIFDNEDYLSIQNFHHDSPTGNEWYYIHPKKDDDDEDEET